MIHRHPGGEVSINLDGSVQALVTIAGWLLVISAVCVRCSAGTSTRFQDEYAPGATANAAERSLELQEKSSTCVLLLGLGSLVLILQAIQRRQEARTSTPTPSDPAADA